MRKLPNATDFNFGFGKLGITAGTSAQVNKNSNQSNTSADSNSVGRAPVQDLDTINLWNKVLLLTVDILRTIFHAYHTININNFLCFYYYKKMFQKFFIVM